MHVFHKFFDDAFQKNSAQKYFFMLYIYSLRINNMLSKLTRYKINPLALYLPSRLCSCIMLPSCFKHVCFRKTLHLLMSYRAHFSLHARVLPSCKLAMLYAICYLSLTTYTNTRLSSDALEEIGASFKWEDFFLHHYFFIIIFFYYKGRIET